MSRRRHPQLVSDIFGRPHHVAFFRQGPGRTTRFTSFPLHGFPDDTEPVSHQDGIEQVIARLEQHKRALVEAAQLTSKQRRVVEEVIFRKRTLEDAAADEGRSAQALWYRIEGTRGHGGIRKKAPVLYALWIFRNRERHDISEVINAIRRAIDSLDTQPTDKQAPAEASL